MSRYAAPLHIAVFLGAAIAFGSGCTTPRRAPDPQESGPAPAPSGVAAATGEYGPVPLDAPSPEPSASPEPARGIRPVVVVCGPGMARAYACVGALRALQAARIQIGAVFGTEVGAVLVGLYGMAGTVNGFEWSLLKVKDDAFLEQGGILSRWMHRPASGAGLESALTQALGRQDLAAAKVPVKAVVGIGEAADPVVIATGPAVKVLRAAAADRELIAPGKIGGAPASSAADRLPFAVREAQRLGLGPVVVVDALASEGHKAEAGAQETDERESRYAARMTAAREAAKDELSGADVVIAPDLAGFRYLDFKRRNDVAHRGRAAASALLGEIRKKAGYPE